jgi:hypothetical protein
VKILPGIAGNSYRLLGLILGLFGAALTAVAYFVIDSIPLTTLGISSVIVGMTCLVLGNSRPNISPEACQVLLETGMENSGALLEELGVRNRAIYLPSGMRDGHSQALVPLKEGIDARQIVNRLSGNLFVQYGVSPDETGIAITNVGCVNVDRMGDKPGPTAGDIAATTKYLLSRFVNVVEKVRVRMDDGKVEVEIHGDRLGGENAWYYQCLGSPIASIAAAVTSEALQHPVKILEEHSHWSMTTVTLEVLS